MDRQMNGWMNKKNRLMAGWMDRMDRKNGWLDGKKIYEKIYGWLNGYTFFSKIDGRLDGREKKKDGWIDIKMDGWMERKRKIDGWMKTIHGWLDGYKQCMHGLKI